MAKDAKVVKKTSDASFYSKVRENIRTKRRYDIKEDYLENVVAEVFNAIGEEIEKNKNVDVPFEFTLKGILEIMVTYRSGNDGSAGNFGIGMTAMEELKKYVKDDAAVEDAEDEEDDEDDD